ncbi:MAG TPA: YciI family protein [Terriglobales bacterium]|nr:YciI family protein [Terriglobales bacterium]
MKRTPIVIFFLSLLLSSAVAQSAKPEAAKPDAKKPDSAQQDAAKPASANQDATKSAAPMQMMTYQLVLLRNVAKPADAASQPGAQPTSQHAAATARKAQGQNQGQKMMGHLANLARLNRERINLIYGPFTANGAASLNDIAGIAILDVPDAATARKHFAEDPFVKAGDMTVEVKPWFGPRGYFAPPAVFADDPSKIQPDPLIFGVLVRGPAAKITPPVHTLEQRQEIQKGHLAYLGETHKQGKLVMAGPFMEDGDWRGIVVYRVASVDEAQKIAADDPAVKAGRLALEARPWMTLKGILK